MANETNSFLSSFNKYLFTNVPEEGIFLQRPYKWAVSIHDSSNNPNGATLDSTWITNANKRKSVALVLSWSSVNNDFSQGIANNRIISFDYVPTGETWTIVYYIIWAVVNNSGTDVYFPIYSGQFNPPITLNELQVLQFPVNTFRIIP